MNNLAALSPRFPFQVMPARVGARLQQGLVEYWPLNEQSGVALGELRGLTLTDNNTVTSAAGVEPHLRPARQFTAANSEYLSIASNALLQVSTGSVTFVISAYLDTISADRNLFSKYVTGSNEREYRLLYRQAAGAFVFATTVDGTGGTLVELGSNITPAAATWYTIFCGVDTTDDVQWIWTNGDYNSTAKATAVFAATSSFLVGAFNSAATAFHDGQLAGLGIWDRTVPRPEREWYYQNGLRRAWPWRGR